MQDPVLQVFGMRSCGALGLNLVMSKYGVKMSGVSVGSARCSLSNDMACRKLKVQYSLLKQVAGKTSLIRGCGAQS